MSIGGYPSVMSSVSAAFQSADQLMMGAASSIATGDASLYVDAAVQMTEAKAAAGIGAALARTENNVFQSTLDMLV